MNNNAQIETIPSLFNWGNIIPGRENNFRTYSQSGIGGYEIGTFDFNSVMLYGSFAFTNNGNPTITRLNGTTFVGQRNGLSPGDLEMIDDMYGCPPPEPEWVGPPRAYTRNPDPTICTNIFLQYDEYKLPVSPGAQTYTLKSNSPYLWVNGFNSSDGVSTVQPNTHINLTSNRAGNYTITLTTSNQYGSKTATIYVTANNCSGGGLGGGF